MFHLLTAVDPSIGRVDISSLSEQALMELLVADIHHLDKVQNKDGEFLDITEWKGIEIVDDAVTKIELRQTESFLASDEEFTVGPEGSIELQWLPQGLDVLDIEEMALEGTIETSGLPRDLRYMDISGNSLSGTFCTKGLPENIEKVFIGKNNLHGSLHLESLPRKLIWFYAEKNEFSGELDFSSLPVPIETIYLKHNQFSGSIDLRNIPDVLGLLELRRNQITQETLVVRDTSSVKKGILRVFLDHDKFSEVVSMSGEDISDIFP